MNTESVLREVFADRAATVDPPTDVYAAVRRRHRRRQQSVVTGAVMLTALLVGVPAVVAGTRTVSAPPAGPAGCPATPQPRTAPPAQAGSAQGSLGSDRTVLAAVADAAADALAADPAGGLGRTLVLSSLRVRMAERTGDGDIVAVAEARDAGRTVLQQYLVAGPDAGHLLGFASTSMTLGRADSGNPDVFLGQAASCGVDDMVVMASPGSTGTITWPTGISAAAKIEYAQRAVPFRPDGVAVLPLPAPAVHVRLAGGRGDAWLGGAGFRPNQGSEVDLAAATAPGDGDHALVADILATQFDLVPFRQSDLEVLWTGQTPEGATVAVAATTLPGGARYVWGGLASGAGAVTSWFGGYLAAGALDHTALRWAPAGRPILVVVPDTKEVRVRAGGVTRAETVTGGLLLRPVEDRAELTVLDSAGQRLPVQDVRTLIQVR